MNIGAVNSNLNFAGKYQLDANQAMSSQEACLKRDAMLGVWSAQAKDGGSVYKQLQDFMNTTYKEDKTAPCLVELEIPNEKDQDFEKSMNVVGQKFTKLA